MTCHLNECLQEAHKTCGTCSDEFCDEHIKQCVECKTWFCDSHFNKHECKEEKANTKELATKKSKSDSNNNSSHSVALRKSGAFDFNTINTSDTVLEIHHIDVGQGDSTLILIKSVKGNIYKSILIDAGLTSKSVTTYFDKLINEKSFRPIDILIITHPDKDHVGGAPDILKKSAYTNSEAILYDNGKPHGKYDREYDTYLGCAVEKKLTRKRPPIGMPVEGGIILSEHGVILRCLACNGIMSNGYSPDKSPYYCHTARAPLSTSTIVGKQEFWPQGEEQLEISFYPTDKNDVSIALHLEFGKFSYFTAGDLSGSYEEEIAIHINLFYGPVSAWKAGHHGAGTCTSNIVTGCLQGGVCVFSFGDDNGFGHPHQAPIDHLESLSTVSKIPCVYYCTGQAANRNLEKPPCATLEKNGLDKQGSVVIWVMEDEVKKSEKFHVRTEKIDKDDYDLGPDRKSSSQIEIKPSANLGQSSRKRTQEDKNNSEERKRLRIEQAREAFRLHLEKALKKRKKIGEDDDSWMEKFPEIQQKIDEEVNELIKSRYNTDDIGDYTHLAIKGAVDKILKKYD